MSAVVKGLVECPRFRMETRGPGRGPTTNRDLGKGYRAFRVKATGVRRESRRRETGGQGTQCLGYF